MKSEEVCQSRAALAAVCAAVALLSAVVALSLACVATTPAVVAVAWVRLRVLASSSRLKIPAVAASSSDSRSAMNWLIASTMVLKIVVPMSVIPPRAF